MARNISIYDRALDLQDHEVAKIYLKAVLGLKEDGKYEISQYKLENYALNFALQVKKYILTKS